MKIEDAVDTGEYNPVGLVPDQYGHGPVLSIGHEGVLWVCLDCGHATLDNRTFAHVECDRGHNPINQTLRERLEQESPDGKTALPYASDPERYPIGDE